MNTFSHLKIGRILYESLVEDARGLLSYRAFLWGNISPDFSVRLLTCPHYIENYSSFLKEELAFLFDGGDAESAFWADTYGEDWPANAFLMPDSDVPNPDLSVRLGVVCHFLTDFFCFAHTKGFTGTMREHIRYEKELDRYLRNFCAAQFHSCRTGTDPVLKSASAALENLEQLQDAFLSQPHAFETDVRYSLHACTSTVSAVAACILAKKQFFHPHYGHSFAGLSMH